MATKGFFRGYPLIWIDNRWVYEDNHEDIPANGGKIRPCKKCGALFPLGEGEVDSCLGILPGVSTRVVGTVFNLSLMFVLQMGSFLEGLLLRNHLIRRIINEKS